MNRRSCTACVLLALGLLVPVPPVLGQEPPAHDQSEPDPIPPPVPKPKAPEQAGNYEPLVPDSDDPWGLDPSLLEMLFEKAVVYRDFTRRFTCTETARLADYDGTGTVSDERIRRYGYLLTTSAAGDSVRELRQLVGRNGTLKPDPVEDEEPFPPAYAWVFLFSRFNEPYFGFRYLGDRFDGFDWVHEIQFKGGLPFTDGKDIRQWEGMALVDAVTFNPIEIRAEPTGQRERIDALYRRWSGSFNVLGMHSAPKPLGFRARIQFRDRKKGLSFPTELRYDTFRAVSPQRIVPTKASTRSYQNYQFFGTTQEQEFGEQPAAP